MADLSNTTVEGEKFSKIIFGLVGAIGTDFDKVFKCIKTIMLQFRYETEPIRLSKFIKKNEELIKKVYQEIELKEEGKEDYDKRCDSYMDGGNILRYCSDDNSFLALEAINKIKNEENKRRNIVYVLDSFKHPDEIIKIRKCYGSIFFLIGVHSSKKNRINVLQNMKDINDVDVIERLIKRDEDEKEDCLREPEDDFRKEFIKNHPGCHKSFQKTGNAYKLADIYISVDGSYDYIKTQIERFVYLLFGAPYITPTKDEYGMYHAYSAALCSGSLARQVGASILTKDGDLVSSGYNDVPQTGGGLYSTGEHDNRDLSYGYDSNKKQLNVIIDDIAKEMKICGVEDEKIKEVKKTISAKGKLKSITEYGRAVHAEMEAILSCCRNGVITKNCVMYVTLFSCHNCTKHLICAGIKKVIYVEPYPKSYATILHEDDVFLKNPDECDKEDKVAFEPFIGISGRKYFDLFSMDWGSGSGIKRKDKSGKIIKWTTYESKFRFEIEAGSIEPNEKKAIFELNESINNINNYHVKMITYQQEKSCST